MISTAEDEDLLMETLDWVRNACEAIDDMSYSDSDLSHCRQELDNICAIVGAKINDYEV